MKHDNLSTDLRTAVDVALLKHQAMDHVAKDKEKTKVALGIIVVTALLAGIGIKYVGGFVSLSWTGLLTSALFQIISTIIGLYVLSVVAVGLFKGKGKHDAFFRVAGFGLIVTWLSIFPPIGIIGGIWGLVVLISVLKYVHKLTTGGVIGTLVVGILAMFVINMILIPVLGFVGIHGGFGGKMDFRGGSYFNDGFKMNFKSDDGEGSMRMEDGKMTIEGPDGEMMEIEIPDYN